jgi:Tfp pilus assembly protein PilN
MRPVNLIPEEQRRGASAALRSGPLAYMVVGALVALLAGVTLLVITNNEISGGKSEVAQLESENASAQAKAARLTAYTNLRTIHDQRVATVTSLADSRFDWERVIRELSLILPPNAWLTNLTGTASPSVAVNGAASVALRDSVPGPALELVGCASSQDAVAGFISDLKDIDGATRVAVQSSVLGDASGSAKEGEPVEATEGGECQTRDFIAKFEIVVAFDGAPTGTAGS